LLLCEIIKGIEITGGNALPELDVCDIAVHSDSVKPGGAFICLRGLTSDGHSYIDRAVCKGASLIIAEDLCLKREDVDFLSGASGVSYITVKNTRRAAAFAFDNFYLNPSRRMKMYAVTGTNGKTTTASLLNAVFREAGFKSELIGTVTGPMTTPDPEMLYPHLKKLADSGIEYVVMEASSHALAYDKLAPIIFEGGIFTNLTPEHLDFHADMEDYFSAKAKLFEQCRRGYFNYDCAEGRRMYRGAPCDRFYYSIDENCSDEVDFRAKNIEYMGISGSEYDLFANDMFINVKTPLPGKYNISNTISAAAAAIDAGIDRKILRDAIRKMKGAIGRMERVPCRRDDITVFIDYAHTPDALENLLRAVRSMMKAGQSLTVLFGCGGDRDRYKRPVMGAIASRLADHVIVTSDNSRSENPSDIIAAIIKGIDRERSYRVIEDRREAILTAIREAKSGEIIILAGKGHENYEISLQGKKYFDEREIVSNA